MRNLKVCHLTTVHPSSDIRIFHKECKSLANAGYEVVLIGQNHADKTVAGIQIRALPEPKNRWSRISRLPWRALRRVRDEKPDICHFHDPELIPVAILLKLTGLKVVYDVHEDYPRSLLSSDRAWLPAWCRNIASKGVSASERLGVCFFDGIIAATPAIAKRFPSPHTITLNNYPILNELSNENSLPYKQRSPIATYTGVISLLRGIREMIHALDFLPAPMTCTLALAGKFDSPVVEEEIKQLPGWKHVDFRGWLPRKEVAELFAQVKIGFVFFHPVPNHVEAQPNKLFEYMSAGIPVIASDFPLWREIVTDANCGLLVDPLDPRKIAEAITWLLEHPEEAEAMGERGRQAVKEKYNWDREAKKLLAFYEKILG